MSLQTVNLAEIIGKAQKKRDHRSYKSAQKTLDMLSNKLEENSLSEYFDSPLTDKEQIFFKNFFNVLSQNLKTDENIVDFPSFRKLKIDLEVAKQLSFTFGIRLAKIEPKTIYLMWAKI